MTKHRALTGLQEWIEECLSTDVTPLEIYTTVIETVKKNARYHEVCASQSRTLLAMLKNSLETVEEDFWTAEDKPSYEEMIEKGYEMSGEGFWIPKEVTED
tara:strand:- start:851 stop:1153 length:303 start_codon:yes stop_codon:yes gene_type:complete